MRYFTVLLPHWLSLTSYALLHHGSRVVFVFELPPAWAPLIGGSGPIRIFAWVGFNGSFAVCGGCLCDRARGRVDGGEWTGDRGRELGEMTGKGEMG